MAPKPSFSYLHIGDLIGAAGGDPWAVEDQLHAGDAGAINDLADAFHRAGSHVKDADDQFNQAKEQFKSAYNRANGSEHPINDAAEVKHMSARLAGHPEELTKISVTLEQTAAALASAQRDALAEIAELDAALHSIDLEIGNSTLTVLDAGPLFEEAKGQTKMSLGTLENIQGAYIDQLHNAETAMANSGYLADALASADALPGNASQESAEEYRASGQLDKDRKTVADAAKLDPTTRLRMPEVDEAQHRLDDYAAITDPDNKDTSHIWYKQGDERADAQHLAGERLNDWNVAMSTGPMPRDPILGGDMRDRAKNRLYMQRALEDGQLPWHQEMMSRDDATKLMDNLEVQDRTDALTRLRDGLIANNVSPAGADAVVKRFSHGILPKELQDAAQPLGWSLEGAGRWAEQYSKAMSPGAVGMGDLELSGADLDSLKTIGKRLGHASSALEIGMGLYEWQSGQKSFGEAATETGGALAGAWMMGQGGAVLGEIVAGPPGAFVVGTAGAVTGGLLGKTGAEEVYKYFGGD